MRYLDRTSIAVLVVGVALGLGSAILLDNLSFDTPGWLLATLGVAALIGAALVVLSALGFLLSAALVDRRDDEIERLEEASRMETRLRAATLPQQK